MIFDLAQDFHNALAHMPHDHPRNRTLELLEEALRRDIHFIDRHPTTLFQCMWNTCWWYDCPEAQWHSGGPVNRNLRRAVEVIRTQVSRIVRVFLAPLATRKSGRKHEQFGRQTRELHQILEMWRANKGTHTPGFEWLRSLRPPHIRLGTALRAVFRGHEQAVHAIAFSADGTRLASASADTTVRVWDLKTGRERYCLRGHDDPVIGVMFTRGDSQLVTASGLMVSIWDISTGTKLAQQHLYHNQVTGVAASSDGAQLATSASPKKDMDHTAKALCLWRWHGKDGARGMYGLSEVASHWYGGMSFNSSKSMNSVAFSPNDLHLASGSDDKAVRVWQLEDAREIACLSGHRGPVNDISYSPEGARLASASEDKTVRVWDLTAGQKQPYPTRHDRHLEQVASTPRGRWELQDQGIYWDEAEFRASIPVVPPSREQHRLRGHNGPVYGVDFSPDGRSLASGSRDGTVRVWDSETGTKRACIRGHQGHVLTVAFSPDGTHVASGSADTTVRMWDPVATGKWVELHGHIDAMRIAVSSSNGNRFATVGEPPDSVVRLWDLATGREAARLRGHKGGVSSVAFAPDGSALAVGDRTGAVRVWNVMTGRRIARIRGHSEAVSSLSFSPDGTTLASRSTKDVRLWDPATGQPQADSLERVHWLEVMTFSPDRTRIAGGFSDNTIRIWDAGTGRELACLCGHEAPVTTLVYSPDGARLASASRDGTVRVWDLSTGTELASVVWRGRNDFSIWGDHKHPSREKTHKWNAYALAFSPDNLQLAVGYDDGDKSMVVWEAATGQHLAFMFNRREPRARAAALTFSPDSKLLVGLAKDGNGIEMWERANGGRLPLDMSKYEEWIGEAKRSLQSDGPDFTKLWAWETASHTIIERIHVKNGLAIPAPRPTSNQNAPLVRDTETVIEDTAGGAAVTWFPEPLSSIAAHPIEPVLAGGVGNYLCLMRREGGRNRDL